jgi:PAS domain S-box-containing protein
VLELTHPEDVPQTHLLLRRLLAGEITDFAVEKRYVRRDGAAFWAHDTFAVLRDPSGRPQQLIGVIQDVGDRKRAEAAVRESEERYRFLAESLPEIVWTARPDGVTDYNNSRLFEYVGKSPREMQQLGWRPFRHPDDRDAATARWRESVDTGKPYECTYRLLRGSDSTWRWHLARAIPMRDALGRVVRWFGTCTDIDDQKRIEEQLARLVDELNRSNRDLEDFAYIASHDLKEPLRGIRHYAAFVLEDYADRVDAEGRRKLETIDRLGKRMDALITSLLHYSQVGRTELAIEETPLDLVVADVVHSLRPVLEAGNVEIRSPGPLPVVRCDRVRVTEVYRNLITNAAKYNTGPKPWIEIGARERPAPLPPVLYVKDNGIGIAEKHFQTVFTMFERLHERDAFGGGTGAGLAFVKRIVERHGGRVWIESKPGEGSTFFFTLERERHAAGEPAHPGH